MIKLGLLSFSDGRERVHKGLAPDIRTHEKTIQSVLNDTGEIEVCIAPEIVYSVELARSQAQFLADQHLDGVIFNLPVFAFPNFAVIAAQMLKGPFLLLGPQDARYPGLGGLLAAAGALNQVGIAHDRLWVDLADPGFPGQVLSFARAAAAATRLRGQVFGLVGGRSIGMYTGGAPAELWQRVFGVDCDHVDQSEIIRLAKLVPAGEVGQARAWLEKQVSQIVYDGIQLTPEKLEFELRCYIALKQIVGQYHFDFVGLKCHFDMSEFFSVQCFSATFLNDPYDYLGPKQITPLACEADADGALTMEILKLASGKPTCLVDWRFYDAKKQVYNMPNCGAAATWFAARSDDPAENLAQVRIVPSISKYAGGGAHVEFVFAAGELTLARLSRSPQGYCMTIGRGESRKLPLGEVAGSLPQWPHAYVHLDVQPDALIQKLQANHMHFVAGDYTQELIKFCRIMNIETILLG
jgi:L-fucose/D-arabinose isomerase